MVVVDADLRLEQPRNYTTLLDLIQNLGQVTDNNGKVVKERGTMMDISGDALGRAGRTLAVHAEDAYPLHEPRLARPG